MSDTRIKSTMTIDDMIDSLAEGNPGAVEVLYEWIQYRGVDTAIFEMLELDVKHLYGHRIWVLYRDVCDEDIERFMYHVMVELPDQRTGDVSPSGPFRPSRGNTDWWERRAFGIPGSFWALMRPPTDPNYEYPIG